MSKPNRTLALTPRPWLCTSTAFNGNMIQIERIKTSLSDTEVVASMLNDCEGAPELAQLFAASPMLLEACKLAVDMIADASNALKDRSFRAEDLHVIREAIAFATYRERPKFKRGG
jgi:hypothetical protein